MYRCTCILGVEEGVGGAEGGGMLTPFKLWPGAYSVEMHRNNYTNSSFSYTCTCNYTGIAYNSYYDTGEASRLLPYASSTLSK